MMVFSVTSGCGWQLGDMTDTPELAGESDSAEHSATTDPVALDTATAKVILANRKLTTRHPPNVIVKATVGLLELNCQVLLDPEQSHSLLVYTAVPGSESYEKLKLLSVIGAASA